MDGPRFFALARPSAPTIAPLSRRTVLRGAAGLAGGLAASLALPRGLTRWSPGIARAAAASPQIVPSALGNPAVRILLPGDAGLHDFGLDFALTGPPAVFVAPGDTPGWSTDLQSAVGGFAFGYAATLAQPHQAGGTGRAVQACVHHGFPSTNDADAAWASLTAALASSGGKAQKAKIKELDVVELVVVEGQRTILATVGADLFDAIVVASRAGSDLVTVAIADFTGKKPTKDEAVQLAQSEAEKVRQPRPDPTDLAGAYGAQWTPGFGFGASNSAIAGTPFFAWPTVTGGAPIPFANEAPDVTEQRRQTSTGVQYQSHVEGPFFESAPTFDGHGLYYSGQTSFFGSSGDAETFHNELTTRLKAGLPGVKLTKIEVTNKERRYSYRVTSSIGTLCGVVLHRLVVEGTFPLGFSLHVLSVPATPDTHAPSTKDVRDRLDPVLKSMADALEVVLLAPDRAPLSLAINPPA
jgi:hypothetical protein